MATTTLRDVAIMQTGTWDASTGRTTIEPGDLAAMVAAHADQIMDRPPIKIGHTDARFKDDGNDGDPAYGWVENLHTSPDGQTLLGDIVGMPSKLAEIVGTAYRRRSAEIAWGAKSASGKVYKAVLTGLALLGKTAPAVKGLADVMALYSASGDLAEPAAIEAAGHSAVLTEFSDTPTIPPPSGVSAEPVGDGATSGGPSDTGGAAVAVTEMSAMSAIRDVMSKLPANAPDSDVMKALAAAGYIVTSKGPGPTAAEAAVEPVAPVAPGTPVPVAVTPAPITPEPAPVATAAAAPVTQVDTAQFAAQQSTISALSERIAHFEAEKANERRNQVLDHALKAGKIHPTVVSQYRAMLDSDEHNTTALLEALPAVLPVTEIGHSELSAPLGVFTDDDLKAANHAAGLEF